MSTETSTHCANCGGEVAVDAPHQVGQCDPPATTLTVWLLAQIAADEAAAQAILARMAADPGSFAVIGLAHPELAAGDCPSYLGEYDPARVLRQCAAFRAIVAEHNMTEIQPLPDTNGVWWEHAYCRRCTQDGEYSGNTKEPTSNPCVTLRALAQVYADRPGFQEGWA